VINADAADATKLGGDLLKNFVRMQTDISNIMNTNCAETLQCTNTKVLAWHGLGGFLSGLVKMLQQGQASLNETEDATHSSFHSVRYSMGMYRAGAASSKTSSHTTTRQKSWQSVVRRIKK